MSQLGQIISEQNEISCNSKFVLGEEVNRVASIRINPYLPISQINCG